MDRLWSHSSVTYQSNPSRYDLTRRITFNNSASYASSWIRRNYRENAAAVSALIISLRRTKGFSPSLVSSFENFEILNSLTSVRAVSCTLFSHAFAKFEIRENSDRYFEHSNFLLPLFPMTNFEKLFTLRVVKNLYSQITSTFNESEAS